MAAAQRHDAGLQDTLRQLSDPHHHKLLFFFANSCSLCKALQGSLKEQLHGTSSCSLVPICADEQMAWAPEMLHYQVEKVPCFVMLDPEGRAIAKSGPPRGYDHMVQTLTCMVKLALPDG